MKNNESNKSTYLYLSYVDKPAYSPYLFPNSMGELPRIKMNLPEISMSLVNVEILV